MKTQITNYCRIQAHTVVCDGQLRYEHANKAASLDEFLEAAYRACESKYAKFFKMDPLCKLALLASEPIFNPPTDSWDPATCGIVLGNRSSSLLSDLRHQALADCPSPAVFVYTLPNIMIGEISIRHRISGENALFVMEEFDAETLCDYTNYLLAEGLCTTCLCGWVDASLDAYDALLYTVTLADSPLELPHEPASVKTLWQESLLSLPV